MAIMNQLRRVSGTIFLSCALLGVARAQEPAAAGAETPPADATQAEALANAALSAPADAAAPPATKIVPQERLNALDLFFAGGILMYPITLVSIVVLACTIERGLALRRRRVAPRRLLKELRELTHAPGGLDPRLAYRMCEAKPNSASRVVRAALLKVGHPSSEIRMAVQDTLQREANRLYRGVRPITLAITVAPLLGLLGTVQGMIMAFFVTSVSPAGVNKSQSLAEGIYTALVTTFAGLCVAIPAAVIAHWFEGRIQNLLGDIEEFVDSLLPELERFEGKVRVGKREPPTAAHAEPPRVAPETVVPRRKRAATPE